MKKTLGIVAASALAIGAFGAPAAAAPAEAACFGEVHKILNTAESVYIPAIDTTVYSVNDVVRAFGGGGKNSAARDICTGDLEIVINW